MSEKYIIKTPSLFKVDDSFQDERFMKVRIAAMHSGKNLNKSRFKTNVIKSAKDTFANIPILANIIITTDENGNKHMDYGSHDMHVEEDFFDSDKYRIIYDEKVVGVVPEHNNFEIIYDEETGNDYVWVDALIYREYGNYCADILESRGGTTDVSAEIGCDEISYDAKDKVLDVNKMTMCAITLLGEDVQPGMVKAHASVFSLDDENREKQIIDIIQELKQSLDKYIASYSGSSTSLKEGGKTTLNEEFEKETEAEVKDTPSAKFDGDGDPEGIDYYEEPESEEGAEEESAEEEQTEEESKEEETADESDDESGDDSDDDEDEGDDEQTVAVSDDDEKKKKKTGYSVSISHGEVTKEFSVSLQDKIEALYTLVNDTYSEQDGVWYDCEVYDDDKYVIMSSWWSGSAYKQSYKVKKDVYSLVGDRVPVKAVWCTEDEQKALDNMRANYSSIQNELDQYKAEPEKLEILTSDCYAQIADTEGFKKLSKRETYFSMSVDEVRTEADRQLLEYAKHNEIKFAAKDESKKSVGTKFFMPATDKKSTGRSRYGGLFAK